MNNQIDLRNRRIMSVPFSRFDELELVESGPQTGVFRLGSAHGMITGDPGMRINEIDSELARIAIEGGFPPDLIPPFDENELLDIIKSEFQN